MQEEVENRTVTLTISGAKLTGRTLKWAIRQFLNHHSKSQAKKAQAAAITPRGKQSVAELVGQNQGVQNIEISDKNIKDFDRVARKYGIDYAVKKDTTEEIPKYLVFFKARDGDALNAAFREYSAVGSENGCQTAEGTETGDYRCHCDHCGPEGVDDPGCGSDHSS